MGAYIEVDEKQSEGQTWYRGSNHLLNLSEEIMKKMGIPYWLFDNPEFRCRTSLSLSLSVAGMR